MQAICRAQKARIVLNLILLKLVQSLTIREGPRINHKSRLMKRSGRVEDSLVARQAENRAKQEDKKGEQMRSQYKTSEPQVTQMAKSLFRPQDVSEHLYSQRKVPPPPPGGAKPPSLSK